MVRRQPRQAIGQPVAEVHGGRRRARAPQHLSQPEPGLRVQVACHGTGGQFGVQTGGAGQQRQTRTCVAEHAADNDVIARTSAAAPEDSPAVDGPDRRDVHHEWPAAAGDVAAHQPGAGPLGQREGALHQPVEVGHGQVVGQRQRHREQARRRAHRRQVAQIDRDGAMADGVGRHEAAVDVHPVDDGVAGDDLEAVAHRLVHRGVVADVDDQPVRRRRQPLPDARDERVFADGGDGRVGEALTWHSRQPAFPGSP